MEDKENIRKNKWVYIFELLTPKILFIFFISFISLTSLVILIKAISYKDELAFDNKVFTYLAQHVSDRNSDIMKFFTLFGSHKFLIPAWFVVFAWYFFIRKNKWYFVKMFIIAASNLLLMFGLKFLFSRQRPLIPLFNEVSGLSFPSGHAFMSLVFFGLNIYYIYKYSKNSWLKLLLITFGVIMIFMIGLSRVYLRLHYVTDVLAGYCFGILSLVIHLWMLKRVEKLYIPSRAEYLSSNKGN
ncbi:MAG: phosphatase PAP2 family protein [Bacteroidota bacterium]